MGTTRTETLTRELAHALRTGPFSAALHLAIEASGLRLEQLQTALAAQGIAVSLTTLSYWRRGRSRPERPDSLRAVHLLEGLLGLPADALTAQLGPRRPRGRWLAHPAGTLDLVGVWRDPATGTDRVGRCLVLHRAHVRTDVPVRVRAVRGCRIGRQRNDPATGFTVAELIFDRFLEQGEVVVVEYEVEVWAPPEETFYHRVFAARTGEYVLQVQFDPAAVPARCFRYERRAEVAPDQGVREIWLGGTPLAQVVASDVPPGLVGIRWEWE